jgi:hypothetical protein
MCTIGVVFDGERVCTFKQCDLIPATTFNEPVVRKGEGGVGTYVAMTRQGSDGIWAGANDAGVAFVAADSYTTTAAGYYATDAQVKALFAAYEASVKRWTTAPQAATSLCNFYQGKDADGKVVGTPFPAPDISLITGWTDAGKTRATSIFIEYMPNPFNQSSVRTIERSDGFFASTNNFRLQPDSVDYPANHSTYLRLRRAEAILQGAPNAQGIRTLLCDQYYGKTELSICRETAYPGQEFRTQATALITVGKKEAVCEYQINGNPKAHPLKTFPWR